MDQIDPAVLLTRFLPLLNLVLGLAVVAYLVLNTDPAALFAVFPRIGGWGFIAIVLARVATVAMDCSAWQCLVPRRERLRFAAMLGLRWIGESINTILPVAQIGGAVVRARLLQQRIGAPGHGAASVTIDFCLSLFAQILFTLLGLVLLARVSASGWWSVAVAAASAPLFAFGAWGLLARRRFLTGAETWAARLGRPRIAGWLQALGDALALLAESRAALARSLSFHFASWIGHAVELWLTLWLMGVPVGFAEAVLLESLSFAARSAAFLIPSGWGAQEASLVALVAATGLSAETALALALVKRAREFAVGLPGLIAWAMAERRSPPRKVG